MLRLRGDVQVLGFWSGVWDMMVVETGMEFERDALSCDPARAQSGHVLLVDYLLSWIGMLTLRGVGCQSLPRSAKSLGSRGCPGLYTGNIKSGDSLMHVAWGVYERYMCGFNGLL
jgi:hypothetical protein